jgi:hypothetical protein
MCSSLRVFSHFGFILLVLDCLHTIGKNISLFSALCHIIPREEPPACPAQLFNISLFPACHWLDFKLKVLDGELPKPISSSPGTMDRNGEKAILQLFSAKSD